LNFNPLGSRKASVRKSVLGSFPGLALVIVRARVVRRPFPAKQGVQFRFGNVPAPDLDKIFLEIALGRRIFDPHGFWPNAIRTEPAGKPVFVQGLAFKRFGPRSVRKLIKMMDEVAAEESF